MQVSCSNESIRSSATCSLSDVDLTALKITPPYTDRTVNGKTQFSPTVSPFTLHPQFEAVPSIWCRVRTTHLMSELTRERARLSMCVSSQLSGKLADLAELSLIRRQQ